MNAKVQLLDRVDGVMRQYLVLEREPSDPERTPHLVEIPLVGSTAEHIRHALQGH